MRQERISEQKLAKHAKAHAASTPHRLNVILNSTSSQFRRRRNDPTLRDLRVLLFKLFSASAQAAGLLVMLGAAASFGAELVVPERPIVADGALADWRGVTFHTISNVAGPVAEVALAHDRHTLYLAAKVCDASPLLNRASDPLNYFKEGDAIDLRLGPWREPHNAVGAGDLRLLLVPGTGTAYAVLYRQIDPNADPEGRVAFRSPVRSVTFDSVQECQEVKVVFKPAPGGYLCEAAIPLVRLGFEWKLGLRWLGDIGILQSNDGGMITAGRCYLFDPFAVCVTDVPTEAELNPARWGELVLKSEAQ